MRWLLRGLLKGLVVGAVLGGLFSLVDWAHHMHDTKLLLGGSVGLVVGACVGKPVWRHGAGWHGVLKGLAGTVLGVALVQVVYWLEPTGFLDTRWTSNYLVVSAALGGLWGAFVGWDDGC